MQKKLISNPIPFQNTAPPTKRIKTSMTVIFHRPSCLKTMEPATTCGYRRKDNPRPDNSERSLNWLKKKGQPMNEKVLFISPENSTVKPMVLDQSIVQEEDEFSRYNNIDGESSHTSIKDELQLLPKETNPTQ